MNNKKEEKKLEDIFERTFPTIDDKDIENIEIEFIKDSDFRIYEIIFWKLKMKGISMPISSVIVSSFTFIASFFIYLLLK